MPKEEFNKFYASAISCLNNEMAENEKDAFISSLYKDDKLKSLFFQLKDVWEYHQLKEQSSHIDLETTWNQMLATQSLDDTKPNPSIFIRNNSWLWQSAAAILIICGLFWLFNRNNFINTVDEGLAHIVECSKGEMVKLSLSDGTNVWLNSDSKLSFNQSFSSINRQLNLVGEAFFDVKSDSLNPFKIDIAGYQVKVKGTSFNLRHYPDEIMFQISLEEGVVELIKGAETLSLEEGDQLNINTDTGKKTLLRDKDLKHFSAWRTGRLEFENISMKQLANYIERWYNHEVIVLDQSLLKLKYTGVLKSNKSIEHVMNVLSVTQPIRYKVDGDKIYIESAN
ncbi:MAG: DUF4974 domain-containing protein [Carboxylicivirga sp.]|jgi:ferric-dicitrate binding protein FerR (iron transport regulator)|nr:DUF4974 domain-containing protein [Carboxylicivirga sp.]